MSQANYQLSLVSLYNNNMITLTTNHHNALSENVGRKVFNRTYLLLNETKSLLLGDATRVDISSSDPPLLGDYSIDVLIVGSQFKLSATRKQFTTWGSNKYVRNFIVSTEYDDPIPNCTMNTTLDDVAHISHTCKTRKFWRSKRAFNALTSSFVNSFGRFKWLRKKKNPAGWICAQRRFVSSFVQVLDLYQQADDMYPDYLIVADDDTYVNMENITDFLLLGPQRLKEVRGGMIEDDNMYVPKPTSPTIYAGCRIRSGEGEEKFWTLPFGGYGIFLSQGALKRMTQPIHCGDDRSSTDRALETTTSAATEYEQAICEKYLHNYSSVQRGRYPFTATLGEEAYFQSGESLHRVFHKYVLDIDYLCIHSDWFFGYIANFLNVSRHVSQKGELPIMSNGKVVERSLFDEDEKAAHISVNRLHTIMSSELGGGKVEGNCPYGHTENKDEGVFRKCVPNATICHYINEEEMERLYLASFSSQ